MYVATKYSYNLLSYYHSLAWNVRDKEICGLTYQQGFVDESNIINPPEITVAGPFEAVFQSDSSVSGKVKG